MDHVTPQLSPPHQALQRARDHLGLARQLLCAGCKRECPRREAEFGSDLEPCQES